MGCLPPETLSRLHRALESFHQQYDPLVSLLKVSFQPTGISKLFRGYPVHPTRESLSYAVALLDTNDRQMHQRATKIVQRILTLQDQNPNSKTYGVWLKYLEATVFKLVPPDPNWCHFLSKDLLQIALYHRHSLPSPLLNQIDTAILHAVRAIQRRNVPYEYTNIAAMGIYITLVAAQIYQIPDLHQDAIARLQGFHDYTVDQDGFSEFNSPTYTTITLNMLGQLRQDVTAPEARQLIENLYRLAWQEISDHFHPATWQWSGPHSRSYSTLLTADVLALIERSTSEQVNFGIATAHPTINEHRLFVPCPSDLEPYFLQLKQPRTVCRTLSQKTFQQIVTTYLTPTFSLGTVNYVDFWHQRRPLLAYWGTPTQPRYLRVCCLHNGIDFAAAQFFSVQREGNVLAGVSFAHDLHPRNPYIDWGKIRDFKLSLKDLRLRFELGGAINANELISQISSDHDLASPVRFCLDGLWFQIVVPYAQFGSMSGKWEVHPGESCCYLDVVLWSGKAKTVHLSTLEAAIGFALQITTENTPIAEVLINHLYNQVEMYWNDLNIKFWPRSIDLATVQSLTVSANPIGKHSLDRAEVPVPRHQSLVAPPQRQQKNW